MTVLVELRLEFEADVFAVRQRARETASALGLDASDQVRVATAVSELARVIVSGGRRASVTFGVEQELRPEMVIVVTVDGRLDPSEDGLLQAGVSAAEKLLDSLSVDNDPPQTFSMAKFLPPSTPIQAGEKLDQIRQQLTLSSVGSPLDELRGQNLELVGTLEELTTKQQELLRLNDELIETNQGVLAMYTQLSEELEETNRGVVALYADLDERGVELRAANEAKSRFLAAVSHELRSPLSSMLGLTRFLRDPDSETLSADQTYQVTLIERSCTELLELVSQLLDLAKAESGKLEPTPTLVSVAELCSELRATMKPLAAEGVDLALQVSSDVSMETDATLLAQLLRNLVSNALKYTEAGRVHIEVEPLSSANRILFRVSDTGIGIEPEHQALVFEEFFQVANPLQRRTRGTGLGLPYARRVSESLGGSISLESTPGSGSTFTVALPLHWVETPSVTTIEEGSPPPQIGTVLVVDDEPEFRVLLRQMLQGVAGRVFEADGARDALEQMHDVRPDLVLLDLRMPSGDGEEVLTKASVDGQLGGIPIVVITSVDLDSGLLRRLSPAFTILNKSDLTREILLEAVRAVVQGARR